MSHETLCRTGLLQMLRRTAMRLAVTLSAVCTLVQVAAAQTEPVLIKGTRVRVLIPASDSQPEQLITGSLLRLEADTVVIWTGGSMASPETKSIALARGRRLEVPAKGRGRGKAGAGLGAVLGTLTGAAIGYATWRPCTEQGWLSCITYPSQGEQAAGYAMMGTAGGALLGLVIGSSIRSETWAQVSTAGVRVAVAPGAVGISLAF